MVIVVQGENNENLLERFLILSQEAQEDLQELIEGAINLSVADVQSDWTDSLITPNGQSFRIDLQKQVEIQDKKQKKLSKKLLEHEQNEDKLKSLLSSKDEQISSLQANIQSLKTEFRSGWESQTENLDSITTLEAQVRFKEVEIQELKHEIAALRVQKNSQIGELKE